MFGPRDSLLAFLPSRVKRDSTWAASPAVRLAHLRRNAVAAFQTQSAALVDGLHGKVLKPLGLGSGI